MPIRSVLTALCFFTPTLSVQAHEFWISPEVYVVENGAQMQAHLRVGEEFKGAGYSFNDRRQERFEVLLADKTQDVQGRLGDRPALSMEMDGTGLAIVVHETKDSTLTYTNWEKFTNFATHKDFTSVLADHEKRGLSKEKFIELYRRFAKSLVAVGDGVGSDKEIGLRTEIIALENPYTDDLTELSVKVLLEGSPRTDVQVELFERSPAGEVAITLHRTDNDGIAVLPVKPGHEYLVDAVAMLPLEAEDPATDPVWYSLWASLTFQLPQ